jgi:hypothetical protein
LGRNVSDGAITTSNDGFTGSNIAPQNYRYTTNKAYLDLYCRWLRGAFLRGPSRVGVGSEEKSQRLKGPN